LALATGNSAFVVGAGIHAPYNTYDGAIAEVLVYDEILSEADRLAIDNYLYTKYTTNFVETLPVPEPSSLLLLTGLLGCTLVRRRTPRRR
jgi:hypothetical protein